MVAQVLPWLLNGGTVVAAVVAQWTPLVGQRRHNGGTRKADVSLTLIHNVCIFYWVTNGRPLCIHSATTAMRVPSSCLLWATCERPTSSATLVRLFWTCSKLHCDHGVHGDVWTSYVPPLNDQGNRSASLLPSTATWPVWWSHKGGTKVAAPVSRGYKARVKGLPVQIFPVTLHFTTVINERTINTLNTVTTTVVGARRFSAHW